MHQQIVIQTNNEKITQSLTHEGCWIFKPKSGGWYSINASEEYIRNTYEDQEDL